MYLPLLRGKQFELLAIRELAAIIKENSHVAPIIEPVRDNIPSIKNCMDIYEEKQMDLYVILNPKVGYYSEHCVKKDLIKLLSIDNYKVVKPAYYLDSNTRISEINDLFSLGKKVCFIHLDRVSANNPEDEQNVINNINDPGNVFLHVFNYGLPRNYVKVVIKTDFHKAILQDCFPKEDQNKKYPPDNTFSDEVFFYKDENRYGFSDYSIIGCEYRDTGGPAVAVAIHIVISDNDHKELRIKHFVSDTKSGYSDPGGKFLEALRKLANWSRDNEELHRNTQAMKEFLDLYHRSHYPGLGYVKKLSLLHHMELCNQIISELN